MCDLAFSLLALPSRETYTKICHSINLTHSKSGPPRMSWDRWRIDFPSRAETSRSMFIQPIASFQITWESLSSILAEGTSNLRVEPLEWLQYHKLILSIAYECITRSCTLTAHVPCPFHAVWSSINPACHQPPPVILYDACEFGYGYSCY